MSALCGELEIQFKDHESPNTAPPMIIETSEIKIKLKKNDLLSPDYGVEIHCLFLCVIVADPSRSPPIQC
jgi:hypothetical protein